MLQYNVYLRLDLLYLERKRQIERGARVFSRARIYIGTSMIKLSTCQLAASNVKPRIEHQGLLTALITEPTEDN